MLESRVAARVLNAVADLESAARDRHVGLAHHGVSDEQMVDAIGAALNQQIKTRLSPPAPKKVTRAPAPPADVTGGGGLRFRLPLTEATKTQEPITQAEQPKDLAKARRAFVEPILTEKGWSILDWANEAEVAYHTAADYLSGCKSPYRSTRAKLAKALGVSANQLPE